ncbi:MAG TPA: DJ-1/PfpI family protein [Solirubrobacteraceae bacterium]|jgi:transcriptional regulator GlxA family with amidase domain
MRIEILLYDGFDELDGIAPYEVLRTAEENGAEIHAVLVGAYGAGTVTASHGTRIQVDAGVSEAAEMVMVPGGSWNSRGERGAWAEARRGEVPATIAAAQQRGARIASVCTGAMLLAAAGITDGRPATTHHTALEDLRESGARVIDARVVDDGDLMTAAGITSGIDLALHIVEQQAGAEIADKVADEIEYERRFEVARA